MNDITAKFAKMGVQAVVKPGPLRIDIQHNKDRKPYFDIRSDVPLVVLDADVKDRHLVLMARTDDGSKPKFLCGFDERGWFAAPLPDARHVRWFRGTDPGSVRGISSVETAKQALKPREVVEAEEKKRLKRSRRNRRHNTASKRQGEWFFIPRPSLNVPEKKILKNEPIRMGRKREHMCAVADKARYSASVRPLGACAETHTDSPPVRYSSVRQQYRWQRMIREATGVYVRGAISAPDHATLHLECWHQVVSNTENRASHAPRVAFLD